MNAREALAAESEAQALAERVVEEYCSHGVSADRDEKMRLACHLRDAIMDATADFRVRVEALEAERDEAVDLLKQSEPFLPSESYDMAGPVARFLRGSREGLTEYDHLRRRNLEATARIEELEHRLKIERATTEDAEGIYQTCRRERDKLEKVKRLRGRVTHLGIDNAENVWMHAGGEAFTVEHGVKGPAEVLSILRAALTEVKP